MKVVLGLSGGVDSAASAIILKSKGYEVIALYFDVTKEGDIDVKNRAKLLSEKLGIEFVYKNVAEDFEDKIIKYFCNEYQIGRTPIPCIFCNPLIKWAVLKAYADEIGAEYIASGHYARIVEKSSLFYVQKAVNEAKDQSYMLARLDQKILSKMILPLGEIESKDLVRNIVADLDYDFSIQKDSQDICFIPTNYLEFLENRGIKTKEGNFIYKSGEVIAPTSKGFSSFTIGQRKGLGIALGMPCYVTDINPDNGDITVSTNEQDLFKEQVLIDQITWVGERLDGIYSCKLRYAAKPAKCMVNQRGKYIILDFEEAQRGPTAGQAAVIYDNDIVVGSGIIC